MNQAFISELDHIWGETFLHNCEKLAKSEPWLDDEELEAKAEEITNQYFYLLESENLLWYWRDITPLPITDWRYGCQ